ncbi:hypothetical protein CH352_18715 [Leptospira hartskeerlii]|uniref:Uncharacterized protein n=1 Tax=Leptospira hartskeerlii TaxID=2023177 RepID=A0A2M9X8C9_9LEPT|nr:hypothetical protein [Leptospira hartskeerlii]PJZ23914.1 hypothetical protein CH357_18645 [Leptospira hartskeerlii]PJZ31940.1 hypothetical protein CH352_18715 [Leptospira hartskeerlii]
MNFTENTYLYVFSTIPQVIAAIIGFSSAFILLRINSYDSGLKTLCDQVITKLDHRLLNMRRETMGSVEKRFDDIRTELTKLNKQNNINPMIEIFAKLTEQDYQESIEEFRIEHERKRKFIGNYKDLVIWGCILLILPLIELPFANELTSHKCLGQFLIIITTSLSVLFLILFARFFAKSIDNSSI